MNKNFYLLALASILLSGCEDEEVIPPVPSGIRINEIIVYEYPVTDGGIPWDDPLFGSATGPDVLWQITGPQTIWSSVYFPNSDGGVLEFTEGFPVFLNDPEATYQVKLWDKDDLDVSDLASSDDEMVSIAWQPFTNSGETGTEWIELTSGNTVMDIQVTYLFE